MARVELVDDVDVDGLVVRARAGDGEAFAALWRMHQPAVHRYISRRMPNPTIAEDLVQDVCVRALGRIGSYELRGHAFLAWLYTIARNLLADRWKLPRYRLEIVGLGDFDQADDRQPDPAALAATHDRVVDVLAVMQTLTELQRRVLELRFLGGLSTVETAAALGVTVGGVKAAQWRALTAVRGQLRCAARARQRVRDHLAAAGAPSRGELAVVPCVAAAGRAGTATGPAETGPVRPPR